MDFGLSNFADIISFFNNRAMFKGDRDAEPRKTPDAGPLEANPPPLQRQLKSLMMNVLFLSEVTREGL